MSTKESFTLWRIPFSLLLCFIAVISSATSDQYDLLIPIIQGYQVPVEITWLIWANRHGLSPIKTLQNMKVNIIFWKIILLLSKFYGTGRYNVTHETTTLLSWRVPKIVSGLLSRMEDPCIKLKIPWYGVRDRFYDDVIKWKHFPRHWPFMRVIP